MKRSLAFLALLAGALLPAPAPSQPPSPSTAPPEKGIALGLFAEDPGFSYEALLKEIAAAGASHVSLVVPYYQHNVRSVVIRRHPRFSPPARVVRRVISQARSLGLKVLLFPILRLEYALTADEWRGSIRPRDPAAWWRSYSSVILEMARMARAGGVESLCVGSELSSMDRDPKEWALLLVKVRRTFRGKLIYSANWDHYRDVGIWGLVDQVGLSAYFQLTAPGEPDDLERLIHAWREYRVQISRLRAQAGKPLVFTEVGYHSQRGTSARPWDESADLPLGMEEQARCYRAFIRAWQGAEQLYGVYFWNWFGYGGPRSREYCPRGKPAAKAICDWFGAAEGKCPKKFGTP